MGLNENLSKVKVIPGQLIFTTDTRIIYLDTFDGQRIPLGNSSGESFPVSAPIGTIVIWYGETDNVPEGWHLCDGTDGTPDMRDKFVMNGGDMDRDSDIDKIHYIIKVTKDNANIPDITEILDNKQDVLTPGDGMIIQDGIISIVNPVHFMTQEEYNSLLDNEKNGFYFVE